MIFEVVEETNVITLEVSEVASQPAGEGVTPEQLNAAVAAALPAAIAAALPAAIALVLPAAVSAALAAALPDAVIEQATPIVDTRIAGLLDTAPENLNTFRELAQAIGNDADLAATLNASLALRPDRSEVNTSIAQAMSGAASQSHWRNPKDHLPDGVTLAAATVAQRTTAWQNCINAAISTGAAIEFSGEWEVNTNSIKATAPLSIFGIGWKHSILSTNDLSGTLLHCQTSTPDVVLPLDALNATIFHLENFRVYMKNSGTPTNTSIGVYWQDQTFGIELSTIHRLNVDGFYEDIRMENCWAYQISWCFFERHRFAGIRNICAYNGDAGDFFIHHNYFQSLKTLPGFQTATGAHVLINAAAGAYVHHNKFYGQFNQAVYLNLNTVATLKANGRSSIFHADNNQFDHIQGDITVGHCFLFDSVWGRAGTPGNNQLCNILHLIRISNNHINIGNVAKFNNLAGAFREVAIVDNYITRGGNIQISSLTDLTITGNVFSRIETVDGVSLIGPTKPVEVTGTLTGRVAHFANEYKYYTAIPDLLQTSFVSNSAVGIASRMMHFEPSTTVSYMGIFGNMRLQGTSALVKDSDAHGAAAFRGNLGTTNATTEAYIHMMTTGATPTEHIPVWARLKADGTGAQLGFFTKTPVDRPVLSYSRTGEPAWATQLRTSLAALGLVLDSTTA